MAPGNGSDPDTTLRDPRADQGVIAPGRGARRDHQPLRTYETACVGEVVTLCPTAASREVHPDIREQVMDPY
jgi:hypothetical protein